MSIESEYEREEDDICERLNDGEIDDAQYHREMRELRQEYQAMAEDAAQDAYDREMDRW